jgi:AmiR/NasT family two-component response regulator
MLMARDGVDADEAFGMLELASQQTNIELRDVAAERIETRPIPPARSELDRAPCP